MSRLIIRSLFPTPVVCGGIWEERPSFVFDLAGNTRGDRSALFSLADLHVTAAIQIMPAGFKRTGLYIIKACSQFSALLWTVWVYKRKSCPPPRLWRLCKINDFWHERERVMFHNARRASGDACVPFGAPWWPSKTAHINIYTQNALSLPEWPWLTWAKSCCWGSFFLALPFSWLKHFPQ